MNSSFSKLQHNFFLVLLVGSALLMYFIWRPFLYSLVIAGSFAIVFHPLYDRIAARFNGKRGISALITVILILLLVLIPFIVIGGLLFEEAKDLYVSLVLSDGSFFASFVNNIQSNLQAIAPQINLDVALYAEQGLEWVLTHLDSFFSGFFSVVINVFIMIIALFFLLRDGRALRDRIIALSPLETKYDEGIFNKLRLAVNSVLKGSIMIAVVQGLFAALGFWITGVPNPIVWGVAAMLASLIPGVGTSLITIPAIIFLLVVQPFWHGVLLAVWAAFGIGLIDNFMAPYVLERGMKIHPFLILISVLGGILYFGPIGFILGPVMLAFFFALLDIYPLIIKDY